MCPREIIYAKHFVKCYQNYSHNVKVRKWIEFLLKSSRIIFMIISNISHYAVVLASEMMCFYSLVNGNYERPYPF